MSQTSIYRRWRGMMARCYDPSHVAFKNYGGRGIVVCAEWHDVTAYAAWIDANLGPWPGKGWTLDRVDNDAGYHPGNLRWAKPAVQNGNQRPAQLPVGSAKKLAKLTEAVVRECRRRFAAGEQQDVLAAEFGVSKPTMHKAIIGKTWQHVPSWPRGTAGR